LPLSINPESLLLEGARRVDEWSLIEKKIPSFDLVFDLDRNRLKESGAELTVEQETLVRLIDGKRDGAGLVDGSGLGGVRTGKGGGGASSRVRALRSSILARRCTGLPPPAFCTAWGARSRSNRCRRTLGWPN